MPTTMLHQEIARATVDQKLEGMRERCQERQYTAQEPTEDSGRRRLALPKFGLSRAAH